MIQLRKSWFELLKDEFDKDYFKSLQNFLNQEYQTHSIYPAQEKIFNALNFVAFDKIKVVIIGQDPYHQPGQAQGLSFSVPDNFPLPPSLVNIFKEIENDLQIKVSPSGNLERWAKQGVLLLNTVLTVRDSSPNSHKDRGWETLTRKIISLVGQRKEPIVFMLWGSFAQSFSPLIGAQHLTLKAPHPSPLSSYRGFFGCKHFSKCNQFLVQHNITPIDWQ